MPRSRDSLMQSLTILVLFALGQASYAASPWTTLVAGQQSEAERLATIDLQRYLAQAGGVMPEIVEPGVWEAKPRSAVVLGTPDNNPLLRDLQIDAAALGEQGYWLATRKIEGVEVTFAAGATWRGAVNAVYGLLHELGYGFYLGSEAIPDSLPPSLTAGPVVRQPVFRVRGVLPWYNFFNSPTTWDPIDHRAFVDQLIRMGANFVGFHTYDSEPFAAYEDQGGRDARPPGQGQMKYGGRLLNTGAPTWGTAPLPVGKFAFGTDSLFDGEYFGAASSLAKMDSDEAIRHEQDIMQAAMDYAHRRGLLTCLGFEISGDPLNPADREVFLKRINRVLDQYPLLDFVWIWQPETQGAQGFREDYNQHILGSRLDSNSLLPAYGLARREAFRRIVERDRGEPPFFQNNEAGRVARATEGARLEQFAQLAHKAMSRRRNPPRLVISGWGGDERLLSAEYYEGLDKLLPPDVVFASLDHIWPRPRVDAVYHSLPPTRERWPIPWLELDGDQWQPQPWVHTYEPMVKEVHKGGSQGLLGIHWRTRDIEENLAYLVQYAWKPGLTAEQFFADYARRCYSGDIAGQMAVIHTELDKLGYRWVAGGGQGECAPFTWGPGEEGKAKALTALRERAAALLPKAGQGRARLQWLIHEMDWVVQYREAELAAVQARDLLGRASGQDSEQARKLAAEALAVLDKDALAKALQTYALRLTTRGEYGVLATMNTKAVAAWRNLHRDALKLAGRPVPEDAAEAADWPAAILLPRLVGSAPAGQDLELAPLVLGNSQAWAHYRPLGGGAWRTLPLKQARGSVYKLVIPASELAAPGIQIGFSFNQQPDRPMAFEPVAVTVMPSVPVETRPRSAQPDPGPVTITCSVEIGKAVPIELKWTDTPEADFYKVYRDGKLIVETAVALLPDHPAQPAGSYVVEAWRDGKLLAKSEPVQYTVPDQPEERFDVQAEARPSCVMLRWPAPKSALTAGYKISRTSNPANGKPAQDLGTRPASRSGDNFYRDIAPAGSWTYLVAPVDIFRREGVPARASIEFQPREDNVRPILELPLTQKPEAAKLVGDVAFDQTGARFTGGHMTLPHRDEMNPGTAMTLAFEFKADSVQEMPVLLCHGLWQVDGWFVQILNGELIIRTPAGDAVGPRVEPGKWYAIRWVVEDGLLHLAVNGHWSEPVMASGQPVSAARELIIGQYDRREPAFAFKGTICNVKLYAAAVTR